MQKHGTTKAVEGSYVEFQAAVLRALPRDIDADTRLGWTNNGESLSRILREALMPSSKPEVKESKILKLISGDDSLTLDACNGNEVLANANDAFAYIDPDFRNWEADEIGEATEQTPVQVYELAKNATFSQMFGSASTDLNKLCFTQAQIKGFVKKHRNWLRKDGYATFFLFKSHNHFFVASVYVNDDGSLYVRVFRLGLDGVWSAGRRYRVVIPQLA